MTSYLKKTSPKNEVILPAYSSPSLVAAVVKAGLTPVLCDMQPSRLTLDLERLAAVVGPQTLAVIAVHLFGIPEDVSAIKKLAETSGFFVLQWFRCDPLALHMPRYVLLRSYPTFS